MWREYSESKSAESAFNLEFDQSSGLLVGMDDGVNPSLVHRSAVQNEKSQRAARRLQKLRSEMRVALGVSAMDTPAEEVDMQLAEVREINSAMLEELRMLAEEAPGVDVGGTLREVGLDLPRGLVGARGGPTGSRTPSRASSVASESSSVRSARGRAGTVQIR